jgi:hypothetical protein
MRPAGPEIDLREVGVDLIGGVKERPHEAEQKKEGNYHKSAHCEPIAREASN